MIAAVGRWTRVRIVACGVVFAALFVAAGRRAVELQIGDESERLRGLAEDQYLREIELPPRRGRILDHNGAELASTADVDSIYCNPRQLADPGAAAQKLAPILGLDRKDLAQKLAQKRFFSWVKRKVTPEEVAAVKALGLPGVAFTREPRRFYPNRMLAATVMGHSGTDGRGLDGVELAFDKNLRGRGSSLQGMRDALGRDLFIDGMAAAETSSSAGADLILTLDRYLTFVTERAIAEAAEQHRAKGVVAVIMDPRNGDLLAMASVPSYNPNDPSGAAERGARNRAITDAFEPGSTMKTFTIASALDAGVVRPRDLFDCMMGKMAVGKYTIHDTHPHGTLTVAEVFKFSSNIGASKIARRLGRDRFAEALARFGFGRPTGVGLPGERGGVLRPAEKWGDIGLANVSFGQGITATPLQLVSGVSAIAAGGVYHPPRIVSRIVRPDGADEPITERPVRRVLSEKTAREMTDIMVGVTEVGGTARAASIDGYAVAGKTGTAQKVSGGHYDASKWVSSFVGFAPADDPRVAIVVLVDEPQGAHLGGAVAAPVWKEIAEQALRYLHVPPSATLLAQDRDKKKAAARPTAGDRDRKAEIDAADDLEERPGSDVAVPEDGDPPVVGTGEGTVSLSADDEPDRWREEGGRTEDRDLPPALAAAGAASLDLPVSAPAAARLGARVESDASETPAVELADRATTLGAATTATATAATVPNFVGLSVAAVLRAARRGGVALAFDDRSPVTGVVLAQAPPPGPAPAGPAPSKPAAPIVCRLVFGKPR